MSGSSRDGGGSGGDLHLVAVASRSGALTDEFGVEASGDRDGVIVEYTKNGPWLREDEEDHEVKLRRIMENVPCLLELYREMRRREQDRLMRTDADYQKRKELAEFNVRRVERLKAAEDRTAKKRLKRQKKQRKQEKKNKSNSGAGGEEAGKEDSSDDNDFSDEEGLMK